MESAIERARSARSQGRPYERVWVVFDKDDWPMQNFNRAFDLARSWNEVTACWSNECFEIWYLLHFHYRDTPIPRQELSRLISAETGKKYDKADAGFQKVLEPDWRWRSEMRGAWPLKTSDSIRLGATLPHSFTNSWMP